MDTYPGDLLAGVFPLVFAVDAILSRSDLVEPTAVERADKKPGEFAATQVEDEGNIGNDDRNGEEMDGSFGERRRNRCLFDRFLDAVADSLADEEKDTIIEQNKSDTEYSSEEEGRAVLSPNTKNIMSFRVPKITSPSIRRGNAFDKLNNTGGGFRFKHTQLGDDISTSTAYARALRLDGQGFFQQARIVSVSTRHGFPPSKDPEGVENRAVLLSEANASKNGAVKDIRIESILKNQPIDGILPSGWLEKHVHALPSVLIVVTTFSGINQHQKNQDEHLVETIQRLRYSLATKRDCSIRLVCIAATNEEEQILSETDDWLVDIQQKCHLLPSAVTILHTPEDLYGAESPGMPTSLAIRKLHRSVRDASLAYYLGQARRAKRKHAMLGDDRQPALLPLAVRYCFKIGIFYEFQLKHEKSTKYFSQAYRHLENYYNYIQSTRASAVNPRGDEGSTVEQPTLPIVSSSNSNDSHAAEGNNVLPGLVPLSDIKHQCRSVADWLNFKLLQAGFLSATSASSDEDNIAGDDKSNNHNVKKYGGLVAAANQWRRHCLVFLTKSEKSNPAWNHWSFVAHQRLVMAQLVERHPPRQSLLDGLEDSDEVLHRCSPWRKYESAADAMLRLGRHIQKEKERQCLADNDDTDAKITAAAASESGNRIMRARYMGSMDSDGLAPRFKKEAILVHKDLALEMALHAVSIFENDIQTDALHIPNLEGALTDKNQAYRAGARLYYMVGGILFEMKRYKEAILHFEKALRGCLGWNALELAIKRMLIKCYDNCFPSKTEVTDEQTKNIASMIISSYFDTEHSSRDLCRALDKFAALTGDTTLKWHQECTNATDATLPFWFTVTFPEATHATAGDVVPAIVTIKSNLNHAVHVKSVTLINMGGPITVPFADLVCAENANEHSNGGIIIQAQATIFISTLVDVPKDLDSITSDESGEAQGSPSKGTFVKSARPRTAGMTSAGGARMISELGFGDDESKERSGQWSTRCLGGKPLRCDSLSLLFYPVHAEIAAAKDDVAQVNVIEVTIVQKTPTMLSHFKGNPFEEDNYIASTWLRPRHLPDKFGPRCLRVLRPIPRMVVSNLTNPLTHHKVMEGTVNRILMKLENGLNEECHDIKYRINCSNTLLSIDGSTRHLNSDGSNISDDSKTENFRAPVLVTSGKDSHNDKVTTGEYELPQGWKLVGSGRETHNEIVPEVSTLNTGEVSYIFFDIYRASADLIHDNSDICQTDIDISISYRQYRPSAQGLRSQNQKSVQRNKDKDAFGEEPESYDLVFLDHSCSVTWTPPMSAAFINGVEKPFPSGSRHPSNLCTIEKDQASKKDDFEVASQLPEVILVDGDKCSTRCVLQTDSGLSSNIKKVWFEDYDKNSQDANTSCSMRLLSDGDEILYKPSPDSTISTNLCSGKKIGLSYTVEARMPNEDPTENISTHLGIICVGWSPVPLFQEVGEAESIRHGPIPLETASVIKFRGPLCYLERAPFEGALDSLPPAPQLAVPFDIVYRITNKTDLHQRLKVVMTENPNDDDNGDIAAGGLLLSGLVNGDIRLAPFETQILTYTALATKAGKTRMPKISVASARYQTWVINDASNSVFVMP